MLSETEIKEEEDAGLMLMQTEQKKNCVGTLRPSLKGEHMGVLGLNIFGFNPKVG